MLDDNAMGKVKDKLIELEDDGIIEWSEELNTYVATADLTEPVPFDLAQYLFDLHQEQASE